MARIEVDQYIVDLRSRLGRGSYGEVYKGYDKNNPGSNVAVKRFRHDDILFESAKREFQGMCILRGHENVVRLFCQCEVEDYFYLVMEYCDKGDLGSFMKRENPNTSTKLNIMLDCAKAVAFMHAQDPPIVHRDLKLGNILICSKPSNSRGVVAKICDFGVAKIYQTSEAEQMGTFAGTQVFIAPEILEVQTRGSSYTKAVDTFSLGLVYQIIVNHESSLSDMIPKVVDGGGRVIRDIPIGYKMATAGQHSPGMFILHAGEKGPMPEVKLLVCEMVSYRPADRPAMTKVQTVLAKLCDEYMYTYNDIANKSNNHDVRTVDSVLSGAEPSKEKEQHQGDPMKKEKRRCIIS